MSKPIEMVVIPGMDEDPGDDWMFKCDGCRVGVRSDEALRGSGATGTQYARDLMAQAGWSFQPPDHDLCPSCTSDRRNQAKEHSNDQ